MLNHYLHIRTFLTLAIFWMTMLPTFSVCGMFTAMDEQNDTPLVFCCPSNSSQNNEDEPKGIFFGCHFDVETTRHSCEVCPCEFNPTLLTAKTEAIVASSSEEIPVPEFISDEVLQIVFHHKEHFLDKHFILDKSDPPAFIRNCTWLI